MKKQLKKILAGTLCAAMLTGTVCLAAAADYAIIVSDALPEEVAAKEGPNGEVPQLHGCDLLASGGRYVYHKAYPVYHRAFCGGWY